MAAIARPQPAGGTSIKIALVVFVVLTVLSLTGTIILLTHYSDMQQQVASKDEQLSRTGAQLRTAQQQLRDVARSVIGEDTDDMARIRQGIKQGIAQVLVDPAMADSGLTADSALLGVLKGLYTRFKTLQEVMAKVAAERDRLRAEAEQSGRANAQVREAFAEAIEQLKANYQKLEEQYQKDHQAWQDQVDELRATLEKVRESASQQLAKEREQRQRIAKERDDALKRVESLSATLASFKPRADRMAGLRVADGYVVRVVTGEGIVYINLGANDGVRRGMTFSVYSRLTGVTPDGKGKATLEVVEAFDITSECKVTSSTPGQPILENDLVANPIFDRQRELNFLVAGDFDLDFDGKIDDPGGRQVCALIRSFGGKVVDQLDTRTDFVVVGAPPELVAVTPETDTPETRELAAQQQAARKAFDAILKDAKALSLPILTRTQFLHFIGVAVPPKVSEDTLSSPLAGT